MSLFACDKCGCVENTSCTGGYHHYPLNQAQHKNVLDSYRKVLGLPDGVPYGSYCSACDPSWFNEEGDFGIGPRPEGHTSKYEDRHAGKWHGGFTRRFLAKGMWHTNEDGNLAHVLTLETDTRFYELDEEEDPGTFTYHNSSYTLPRPNTPEAAVYLKLGVDRKLRMLIQDREACNYLIQAEHAEKNSFAAQGHRDDVVIDLRATQKTKYVPYRKKKERIIVKYPKKGKKNE